MRVDVDTVRAVVAVSGEVDLCTAPELLAALHQAVSAQVAAADGAAPEVAVDLADVSFLDARGLDALVAGAVAASEACKGFVVVGPSAMIRKLFRITDLDKVFSVREDW